MNRERLKITVRGAVQGVGFRPFVYRLAIELKLAGWVSNSAQGVFIEVEGPPGPLQTFLFRLEREKPLRAVVQSLEASFLDEVGYGAFEIRESEDKGDKSAVILPDIATCSDCLDDILDPKNRRFRYPFTNCTNCGPRFSIIESLPYDRAATSMKSFTMCANCASEYRDPLDRRFHAQPNACPDCGPHLRLWNAAGVIVSERNEALNTAADAIRSGKILALKGIGGFQLIVAADNETAVATLRERKHREEKPFAVMYPSLASAERHCRVAELEKRLLLSPESPIVLLERKGKSASSIAPRNPNLGVMLPYTPLHHLLMRELNCPVVATSGNLSDEPICIDEDEALQRLSGIADLFLVHNRSIVRHVDDSIVRIIRGRELVLRRARGYAPLPITLRPAAGKSKTVLAVGAHLKNTVALKIGTNVFISQHIGDLETKQAYSAFLRAASDLPGLYDAKIDLIACDMHPDYLSAKRAGRSTLPVERVQHHWAHAVSCMAENEIEPPALGVAWDGTGYGLDGTIWGGEFLLAKQDGSFQRVGHLRQFRLPGGDAAIRQPKRSALGLLHEILGDKCWDLLAFQDVGKEEKAVLRQMLEKKINAPVTSSAGRLFDAVAALTGLCQSASFEGQAAMELEFTRQEGIEDAYSFMVSDASPMVVDWEPAIREMLDDLERNKPRGLISAKFHNGLVEAIVQMAKKVGEAKIALSGGCFQNRYLTERTIERLGEENFRPYWHQRIPPNDGGISLGQCVAVSWTAKN